MKIKIGTPFFIEQKKWQAGRASRAPCLPFRFFRKKAYLGRLDFYIDFNARRTKINFDIPGLELLGGDINLRG